jgi:hypothetical protein
MTTSKKLNNSSKSVKSASNKLSDNIKGFQKRWNVSWNDDAVFVHFKNRLLFLIDKYLAQGILLTKNRLNKFAYYCGSPAPYPLSSTLDFLSLSLFDGGLRQTIIYTNLIRADTPSLLAWYLQIILNILWEIPQKEHTPQVDLCLDGFFSEFDDLLEASPAIQIRISKTNRGFIVYPAGAKLLDEGLVNDNLAWLQDYPESIKAFEQALYIYLNGDKPKYRNLIDNLRVAIEQLLRKVLLNKKSLENQSKELEVWLDKHGVQKQIRNLFGQFLFGSYAILQNDVAKHGDVVLLAEEVEYLIYLTGTFMRLIIQLRRSEAIPPKP